MAEDRSERRRAAAAKAKANRTREKIYIPVPEEFLDSDDEGWTLRFMDNRVDTLDFIGVIKHTLKRIPTKNWGDTQLMGELFRAAKNADGYIELEKSDYDQMIKHFEEFAGGIWNGPDGDYLVDYIDTNKVNKRPAGVAVAAEEAEGDEVEDAKADG